jgi:hypothetical protein
MLWGDRTQAVKVVGLIYLARRAPEPLIFAIVRAPI